ncbi:MAG: hypothetical protein IJ834_04365, partial [Paludibacteraceae bacterium]|nr:hypothetical protein [Paludibacteraceae bacterium]
MIVVLFGGILAAGSTSVYSALTIISAITFIATNRYRWLSCGILPTFAVTASTISARSSASLSGCTNSSFPAAQASKYTPCGL